MATQTDLSDYFGNLTVAVHQGGTAYPTDPPFHPAIAYPEYDVSLGVTSAPNHAYEGVRSAFHLLGLDSDRFGTADWNPLEGIVHRGNTVVVKPNFVLSDHYRGGNLFSVITHPSVLRAVVDYTYKALHGDGQIIIADTPQMDCDFQELLERTRLASIQELYWKTYRFEVSVRDLRQFWFKYMNENYLASQKNRLDLPGDPLGSVVVNLAGRSAFDSVQNTNFYGADFNRDETIAQHSHGKQNYMVSNTILGADVLISVPKLKVHKKVGVTLNAKGFVGMITNKNYLVHYTVGSTTKGGDQFPDHAIGVKGKFIVSVQRWLYDTLLSRKNSVLGKIAMAFYWPYRVLIKPLMAETNRAILLYDGGNWHGNDSAWRMVSDLSKIMVYADKNGALQPTPQRKIFSVIDGIVGGEGNGPLFPDARPVGVILAGRNHLTVDMVGARLMGFQPRALKWVNDLLHNNDFNFFVSGERDIKVHSNRQDFATIFESRARLLDFKPHPGWMGYIEIVNDESVVQP